MAQSDKSSSQSEKAPVPAIRRDEGTNLVHYGFEVDGVFHPFASERSGDHDERVKAAEDSE